MRTLICGSIAYDTIMVFRDYFKNHILPEQLHILNLSFLVPDMRREFGGCAANIAYSLKLLGGDPLIMATVGEDCQSYAHRLDTLRLSRAHVRQVPNVFTAQAFITTDLDDNQITAFHPGAMNFSHHNHISQARDIGLGIVAPDGREGMLQHAREFHQAGIPFIFDPGQGTGKSIEQLSRLVKALVVTQGAQGSLVVVNGKAETIPAVKPAQVVDPTGCGDAYRAGLLYGIANDFDWPTTGRLASLLGSIKIAQRGAQNHQFTRDEISQRFREAFGRAAW